ncbi:MAG: pyrroline-5-carboxylate reductase [Burkholderiales bacterium]
MKIAFIGGGNMAGAIIGGLIRQGFKPDGIRVAEISAENRDKLGRRHGIACHEDMAPCVAGSDVVVLAVKPQQLPSVAQELAPRLVDQLVISIAAGVRATDLSRWLGGYPRIVRAMPNTPAMVQSGVSGLYALPGLDAALKNQAQTILDAVGKTVWLEREEQMDAITAVSGSGPAYVFYFLQAMQEAATELGFDSETGKTLALETLVGAGRLAAGSPEDFATLRANVTSKGGTTERAIATMEAAEVRANIVKGIHAASARSAELGDELGKAN